MPQEIYFRGARFKLRAIVDELESDCAPHTTEPLDVMEDPLRPQSPDTPAPCTRRLLIDDGRLVGDRLPPHEISIFLVLLLRTYIQAIAYAAVGVKIGRSSVLLKTDDFRWRHLLEMRNLLGCIRGLHLKSRRREQPFGRPRLLPLQRRASGQAQRECSEQQFTFHERLSWRLLDAR
jgi:hypothetical protein